MFSVHTTQEKSENDYQSIWICVSLDRARNHLIIVTPSFLKSSVIKMFSVHTKTKSRRGI